MARLRVPGGLGVQLTELLEVIHAQLVPEKMEKDVLQGTANLECRL